MIKTTIEFCGVIIDSGNDIYKTMMKARKLSEGNEERTTVIVETKISFTKNELKTVVFCGGKPIESD